MVDFLDDKSFVEYLLDKIQCPQPSLTDSNFNISALNFTVDYDYFTLDTLDYHTSDKEQALIELEAKVKTFIFITFYVLTFIVGFVGNSLVIYLIINIKKLQSITSLFLVSLATADLLLILVCVPIKIMEFLTHQWILGKAMCKIYHYLHTLTAICSVMNLTAMSLERYFAILHPLEAKIRCTYRRAKIIIFLIWIFSFITTMPILLGKRIVQMGIDPIDICSKVWCKTPWRIFETYRTLILLIIPFFIMGYCYIRISAELYQLPIKKKHKDNKLFNHNSSQPSETENITLQTEVSQSFSKASSSVPLLTKTLPGKNVSFRSHADDVATRRQIIRILMSIVGIFFICWAPYTINNLLIAFDVIPRFATGINWYFRIIFHLLAYSNSCVNPIVYGFMSKRFRDGFRKAFCSTVTDNNYATSIEMQQKQSVTETTRKTKPI